MNFKETKYIELKETYTSSFLKTVSAFSTYGTGEVIFGVNNEGVVVGVDKPEQIKLSIENSIRDNIEPLPEYVLESVVIDKKVVVKLTVFKGERSPYFYRHQVFKRFDTSTAPADSEEIRTLIMKNRNVHFDELPVDEGNEFKFSILESGLRQSKDSFEGINDKVLRTLKLYDNGKYNRGAEIVSDKPLNNYASLDMVRFGETLSIFLDRRTIEYSSLLQQYNEGLEMFDHWYKPYEEVFGFRRVKRIYIPREAYREALANALVHQLFSLNNVAVRVSMFESKIEINSPGGLPRGVSKEEYLNGELSYPRNPVIANVFHQLGYIEKFGTGINRIKNEYKDFENKPEFIVSENVVKVVLPKIVYTNNDKTGIAEDVFVHNQIKLDAIDKEILKAISGDPFISQRKLEDEINVKRATIQRRIDSLEENGFLRKEGSSQKRSYTVLIDSALFGWWVRYIVCITLAHLGSPWVLYKFFCRVRTNHLYDEGVFAPARYNKYDGINDYEFLLDMFNQRKEPNSNQQGKINGIIAYSIIPYLQKELSERII